MDKEYSDLDIKINLFLNELGEKGTIQIMGDAKTKQEGDEARFNRLVFAKMSQSLDLAIQNGSELKITGKGKDIYKNDGWLSYLDQQKQYEIRKSKKDKWDYFYSKYRYFTYWWIFSFSLIGCGLGLYNFTKDLPNAEDSSIKVESSPQMEVESTKERTSSSSLQTFDSLQTPNQEVDSLDSSTKKNTVPKK